MRRDDSFKARQDLPILDARTRQADTRANPAEQSLISITTWREQAR
jgi:hypothetical protein